MARAYSLFEGSYSVDVSKEFIPFDPEKDDPKDRPGSLFIHVHPFLIETSSELIVVDTGLGHRRSDGELVIHHNIRSLGFSPDDVTYVLMSHLHKDHANGMIDEGDEHLKLAYPNAKYVIQRDEFAPARTSNSSSYRKEMLDVLTNTPNLMLVDGDGHVNAEIRYERSGGHSEFHQVFHVEADGEHFFFGGDELPEPEELFKRFVAKYDFDGRKARDLRAKYWEQGAPENWTFLFYHSKNIAVGQPQEKGDGSYRIVDVEKSA